MTARHVIAVCAAVFALVVSSSFAYGFMLLWRGSDRPREGAEGRPAALPPDVAALLERSAERLKKGEVEQAILGYRRVLTQGPSLEAQLGLAEGEWRAGRRDDAVREYERVVRLDASHPTALKRLAEADAGRRETWEQAESRYRAYLAAAPGDAEAWLGLARVLSWRGNGAAAAELYERPDVQPLLTADDRRSYAFALVQAGRGREAEPMLGGLARANPADVDVTLSLGGLHASRADWERALPLYQSAVERRPDDPRANLTYGQGLLAVKDYAAALGPLEKATQGLPSSAEAGIAYARALRGSGDLKRADVQFERVMPLVQGDAAVEREYADLLLERRSYGKATRLYREALGHGLRDERLLSGLAGALSADGRPKEAVAPLEEAYAIRRNARLGLELVRLYRRVGRNDDALRLLDEIEGAQAPRP
ncbi:MAG TPA: tetratricopeptide repeat protein [Vicinamibacteria bacterium]|nr:tetratricopeptide repeat protein [Vicinamibacteria bacterium]